MRRITELIARDTDDCRPTVNRAGDSGAVISGAVIAVAILTAAASSGRLRSDHK